MLLLLSGVGLLAFMVAFLLVNRLNRVQGSVLLKERFKARVGLQSDYLKKKSHSSLPWWSLLGRSLGSDSPKEVAKIQTQLVRAGFREERHYGGYLLIKYGFVLVMILVALILWTWLAVSPEYAVLLAIFSLLLPERILIILGNKRIEKINHALPDFLDMANICMNAGLGYLEAIKRVSAEIDNLYPDICFEFQFVLEQIKIGMPRPEALRQLALRVNTSDINELVQVLIQNEKLGAPISQAINDFSRRMYLNRQNKMEEKAAKASAKMAVVIMPFLMVPYFILLLGEQMVMLSRSF